MKKILFLSVALLLVAVFSVTLNEKLNSENRPTYILAGSPDRIDQLRRAVASAEPFNLIEDIQWETDLAARLNGLQRVPSAVGGRPNKLDELRFGPLAGKYRINELASQIQEIEYIDSQDVSDRPIFLRDRQDFLKHYGDLMTVKFTSAKLDRHSDKVESYHLLDSSGQDVGHADFSFDESGRFLNLKIASEKK